MDYFYSLQWLNFGSDPGKLMLLGLFTVVVTAYGMTRR